MTQDLNEKLTEIADRVKRDSEETNRKFIREGIRAHAKIMRERENRKPQTIYISMDEIFRD